MFNLLRLVIGSILLFGSIALGIYVGFWLMFVGGFVQIIDSIKYDTNALGIAFGFLKMTLGSIAGWATFIATAILGMCMLDGI